MGNKVALASLGLGTTTPVAERLPPTSMTSPQQEANGPSLAQQLAAAMAQLLPQSNAMTFEKRSPNVAFSHHRLPSNSPSIQPPASDIVLTMKNPPPVYSLTNLSAGAGPSLRVKTMSNVKPAPISMTPNVPEKMRSSFSLSPLMPKLSRPQTPSQLWPQLPHVSNPPLRTLLYSSRPTVGNIGPMSDPWKARQSLASNPCSQTNQNNYNALFGGSVQPQLRSGPPREGNEYVDNEGFESWSPENSPNRSLEYVAGRNYPEPRMNSGWSYRPDSSWQGNSSGYRDQNRQGNRRWRDRS
ncbi:hypothetical protein CRYUN_Cryun23aG0097100 [Craigia yunnanensis]